MEMKWYGVVYEDWYDCKHFKQLIGHANPNIGETVLCLLDDGTERYLRHVFLNDMNYPEYALVDDNHRVYRNVTHVKMEIPSNKRFVESYDFDTYEDEE